ncbi:MAG: hypothetical protein U1A28_03385, partial [Patescibacteria group bacterium]|nr:hypothetical protein [Patescibacteria group bacterium]
KLEVAALAKVALLSKNPDAVITAGILLQERPGVVGGAVIRDDELEIGMGLVDERIDRMRHAPRAVTHGQSNADGGDAN